MDNLSSSNLYKKIHSQVQQHKKQADKHHKQKRSTTKAELRRRYFHALEQVVEHIKIFNRITVVQEKVRHLSTIEKSMMICLEHKPGNHILRTQSKLLKETLQAMNHEPNGAITIPLVIDEQFIKSGGK